MDSAFALKRLTGSVNADAKTPVYLQIAGILKTSIEDGILHSGSLLPSERAVCAHFGVSRMTLREAYDVLEREGFIHRHRGRGTFVAPQRVRKRQQEMRSFTEELASRGIQPASRVLSFHKTAPSAGAQQLFELSSTEQVYQIQRLRFGDSQPIALETVELPAYLCPDLERFNFEKASLYRTLEEEYAIRLVHCVEEVSAELADKNQKRLLELPHPSAVLAIRRRTYSESGTPVELALTICRADRYRAVIHASRAK